MYLKKELLVGTMKYVCYRRYKNESKLLQKRALGIKSMLKINKIEIAEMKKVIKNITERL